MEKTQIIYFNGPSSSGKTCLARALQKALEEPFLYVSIDTMVQMMPPSLNDWTGESTPEGFSWKETRDEDGNTMQELHMGPFAKKMSKSFKEVVVSLVRAGHSVLIDDVAVGKKEVDMWKEALKGFCGLYVGVTAPIEVLEQRERERPDRIEGSARAQYYRCHKDMTYDLLLDTDANTLEENVAKVISAQPMSF